jgi:hypothetical protein
MIRLVPRIAAIWLLLGATAALCAGCGKSSLASASGASRAQVLAYVHAINLRASDLTGVIANSTEHEVHDDAGEAELLGCLGLPRHRDAVRVRSRIFADPGEYDVVSVVSARERAPRHGALQLAAEKARYLAAVGSKRGVACNAQFLERAYRRSGGREIHVVALPNPLSGVDGSVGLRFRVTGGESRSTGVAVSAHLYQDVFVLYTDHVEIELQTRSVRLFSLATERRLLALLYGRAEVHKV